MYAFNQALQSYLLVSSDYGTELSLGELYKTEVFCSFLGSLSCLINERTPHNSLQVSVKCNRATRMIVFLCI